MKGNIDPHALGLGHKRGAEESKSARKAAASILPRAKQVRAFPDKRIRLQSRLSDVHPSGAEQKDTRQAFDQRRHCTLILAGSIFCFRSERKLACRKTKIPQRRNTTG